MNRERLRRMKPSAFLINIGRGMTVRLDDLVDALHANEIAGAALDVFEIEPLPSDHPLWTAPNVLITPHTAGYGPYLDDRRLDILLDNCRRFAAVSRCATSWIRQLGFEAAQIGLRLPKTARSFGRHLARYVRQSTLRTRGNRCPVAGADVGRRRQPRATDRDHVAEGQPVGEVALADSARRTEAHLRERTRQGLERGDAAGRNRREELDDVEVADQRGHDLG